jgi:putative membrane-bound dehydrogenase-like protein
MPNNRLGRGIVLLAIAAASLSPGCRRTGPPFSPQEALRTFRLPEGFRIELVASEPDVINPVALSFDEEGRMFVVEMPDYPVSQKPLGKIKVLEDRDGDGRFETSTVFADHLHFPHGVLPWKNGVIVACAPDILYFSDTNGDSRADVRQVLLTGFAQVNPQLRVNTPLYGIDNWIYAAYPKFGPGRRFKEFSNFGEPIRFPAHPEVPPQDIFAKGMDLRFKPDQLKLEAISGNSEYGLAFDARGHRFPSWNDRHVQHAVIENRYLERNPYLAVESAVQLISDHGEAAKVYPITENPFAKEIRDPSVMEQLGHFTSACGQSVYTGGDFPAPYEGAYFICEPVSNLVHCDRLMPHGATFTATRALEKSDFLASKDSWFMPVFTTVGPDGALYVVDFYRKVIEHPEWIRKDLTFDFKLFYMGNDRGRIYRIVREDSKPIPPPHLKHAQNSELVQELSNPNEWWRLTAQRLLVERQDKSVVPDLEGLARSGASPLGRMHALWTLEGLNQLDPSLVVLALGDRDPGVREQAVRLAEEFLSDSAVIRKLVHMTDDPDDQVEFQVACTLGGLPPKQSFEPLQHIVARHLNDPWFQTAVLTSASTNADRWFRATVQDRQLSDGPPAARAGFLKQITAIIGAKHDEVEILQALSLVNSTRRPDTSWWRTASLEGLADGIDRASAGRIRLSPKGQQALLDLAEDPSSDLSTAALKLAATVDWAESEQLRAVIQRSSSIVQRDDISMVRRVNAATALGLDPTQSSLRFLDAVLSPRQPEELQMSAARALLRMPEPISTRVLLQHWTAYTTSIRDVVLAGFFKQPHRLTALLDGIQSGIVQPASLSRSTRQQLMHYRDESIRKRAELLFANLSSDRAPVIERYRQAASMTGDPTKGMEVFRNTCTGCHQVGNMGVKVGPDLATVTNQSKDDLLTNILDPNASITAGYEEYMIETNDGELLTGVMASQTATSVTLRRRKGEEDTVLRGNIREMRALTVSAMPENLEEGLRVEDMANLLEFVKTLGNTKAIAAQTHAHN